MLRVNKTIKEKLQITFEGKPVQQFYLVIIRLLNAGNTPITTPDFASPVQVSFGNDAEILTAEIQKKQPQDLLTSFAIEGNKIVLSRDLLNKGEGITLKALITKFEKVSVSGRITGCEIREFKDQSQSYLTRIAIGLMGISLIGTILETLTPTSNLYHFIATSSAAALVVVMGMYTYKLWKKQRLQASEKT